MRYLAHIRSDSTKQEEQTVEDHLNNTASLAASFAKNFNCEETGKMIGLYHDAGKCSIEFQNRLLNNGKKCDHSTAGAYELYSKAAKVNNPWTNLISAMCIAGHHTGLLDVGNNIDSETDGTFFARMLKAKNKHIPEYSLPNVSFNSSKDIITVESNEALFFYIKMLFSCLVDADFLDTERFIRLKDKERAPLASMTLLWEKFYGHVQPWLEKEYSGTLSPSEVLNKYRTNILRDSIRAGEKMAPGLFSLTVPTGGGKTTASLGFALKHAIKYNKKHIIYVLPYTSIIEQNAAVFRDITGANTVLEFHSGYELDKNDDEAKEVWRFSDNWDVPITVTTSVQFFESMFAVKTSKCRKLHNISNSVIIFDEAQMIPVENMDPCISVIANLVKNFSTTAIMCTATCPTFQPMFDKYNININEIIDNYKELYKKFQRNTILRPKKVNIDELITSLGSFDQALCIVNKKKTAFKLYTELKKLKKENLYYLTTNLTPRSRKEILNKIKQHLDEKNNEKCIVISTSLIEAGVNIDFPTVWREISGLDSIKQSGGRCNRNNKRNKNDSKVHVFILTDFCKSDLSSPNISATLSVLSNPNVDINSPEAISLYFDVLYGYNKGNMDKYQILNKLENGISGNMLPLKTISKEFKMIDEDFEIVYIPNKENKSLIKKLCSNNISVSLFRQLQQDSVSVPSYVLRELKINNMVSVYSNNAIVLTNPIGYNEETGIVV